MFHKGAEMKKLIIVLFALATILPMLATAKDVDLAVRPNFGYRSVDGGADQIVIGGSLDVIFTRLTNGYMATTPGFELSFMDDITIFNVNIPITGRYPLGMVIPHMHMGMAIAHYSSSTAWLLDDTDVEFLLGVGVDIRVAPNLYVGPQFETMSFDTFDIEIVANIPI
jgi:hypothetical protein